LCLFALALSNDRSVDPETKVDTERRRKRFHLETVAEGVEDEKTLALLREWGCDMRKASLCTGRRPMISWWHGSKGTP
jgi:hypothetical protein